MLQNMNPTSTTDITSESMAKEVNPTHNHKNPSNFKSQFNQDNLESSRKFNIIVFGLDECVCYVCSVVFVYYFMFCFCSQQSEGPTKREKTVNNARSMFIYLCVCRLPAPFRTVRFTNDSSKVTSLFNSLDCSVSYRSICDCVRLGKFSTDNTRPRPIKVTLNRSVDTHKILAKSSKCSKTVFIKPDRSLAQRKIEALLLKER